MEPALDPGAQTRYSGAMIGVDEATFCIVDVETASIQEGAVCRVCEIGAIRTRAGEELDRFESLVHPEVPIHVDAQRIHGISDEMVACAPRFPELAPRLLDYIRDSILVAHNTAFDIPVLNGELARAGLPPLKNPVTDTVRLARKGFAGLPGYGLDRLIEFFNLNVVRRHRSIGDCEATLFVFWKCIRRLQELGKLRTLEDVLVLGRNRHLENLLRGRPTEDAR